MTQRKLNGFDRFARHSSNAYRGGGATIATAVFMLIGAFAPKHFGIELPFVIVIGLPAIFFVAVMLHGSRVGKQRKSRRGSKEE